jgi:hypothetical protein
MEWQPIETVPHGVTVKLKGPGWTGVGRYSDTRLDLDEMELVGTGKCGLNEVTHWMLLSEPPK